MPFYKLQWWRMKSTGWITTDLTKAHSHFLSVSPSVCPSVTIFGCHTVNSVISACIHLGLGYMELCSLTWTLMFWYILTCTLLGTGSAALHPLYNNLNKSKIHPSTFVYCLLFVKWSYVFTLRNSGPVKTWPTRPFATALLATVFKSTLIWQNSSSLYLLKLTFCFVLARFMLNVTCNMIFLFILYVTGPAKIDHVSTKITDF